MRQQAADAGHVRRMHQRVVAEMAFSLGALLGQDMILVPLRALEIAGAGLGKALGGAAVRLQFRHNHSLHSNPTAGARRRYPSIQFTSRLRLGGLRDAAGRRNFLRSQHHHHQSAFHLGKLLHYAVLGQVGLDAFEQLHAQFLMHHLTAAKAQRDFRLVAFLQKFHQLAQLHLVIRFFSGRAELQLLHLDLLLLLLGGLALLALFEEVLAVVHDPADRRRGLRRDLHQVQLHLFRQLQRISRGHDTEHVALRTDHPYLRYVDLIVDASVFLVLVCGDNQSSKTIRPRLAISVASFSWKALSSILPRSLPLRVRTATVCSLISRSPTSSTSATRCNPCTRPHHPPTTHPTPHPPPTPPATHPAPTPTPK